MNKKLQKLKRDRKDKRYLNIMGFLIAKGFLRTNQPLVTPQPTIKIDVVDALWAGEHVEPRIFEVLPAAFIHFPKTFYNTKKIPEELTEVIRQIQSGEPQGKNFKWAKYKDMVKWANIPLDDLRTKPIKEQKLLRSYRFTPKTLARIERLASAKEISHTELIETLVAEKSL